ncbi:RNA recognition motif-containing protein, partial [Trifolium medium]|nr:RNA recognition motif-containing protein [Trifolium medium]
HKPIGPVDPSKCTAAGTGIAGGTACAASSFSVVTKDADERKRGNYMVNVECNGRPINGSPFPVFFSAAANGCCWKYAAEQFSVAA